MILPYYIRNSQLNHIIPGITFYVGNGETYAGKVVALPVANKNSQLVIRSLLLFCYVAPYKLLSILSKDIYVIYRMKGRGRKIFCRAEVSKAARGR